MALRPLLALSIAATIGLAACGASGPSTPAAPSTDPRPSPATSSAPPSAPSVAADPVAGGDGSAANPGTGIGAFPIDPAPIDPAVGQPQLVQALPGRQNPRPVTPTALQASVDGRHVLVKVSWYGGVEPCSVLDSVKVERSANDITLTPIEGATDPTAMCIELALLKATIVDLGDLEPGSWRISSPGSEAPPIVITID